MWNGLESGESSGQESGNHLLQQNLSSLFSCHGASSTNPSMIQRAITAPKNPEVTLGSLMRQTSLGQGTSHACRRKWVRQRIGHSKTRQKILLLGSCKKGNILSRRMKMFVVVKLSLRVPVVAGTLVTFSRFCSVRRSYTRKTKYKCLFPPFTCRKTALAKKVPQDVDQWQRCVRSVRQSVVVSQKSKAARRNAPGTENSALSNVQKVLYAQAYLEVAHCSYPRRKNVQV